MPEQPNENAAPAILSSEPSARLDAIVRRHGGKPRPDHVEPGTMKLPMPKRGLSPEQGELFEEPAE